MPTRSSKGLDPNQLAKAIVDEATGEAVPGRELPPEKNQAAVELGKLGGKKGGAARAARLSPEQRVEIARRAAQARWKHRSTEPVEAGSLPSQKKVKVSL